MIFKRSILTQIAFHTNLRDLKESITLKDLKMELSLTKRVVGWIGTMKNWNLTIKLKKKILQLIIP